MRTLTTLGIFICLGSLLSCESNSDKARNSPVTETAGEVVSIGGVTAVQAKELVLRIHTNMTFEEIAEIIPLSTNLLGYAGEHGGVWCDVPIGESALVKLRFEYPSVPNGLSKCRLNSPPILTNRNERSY
jgi:hypothetical protein